MQSWGRLYDIHIDSKRFGDCKGSRPCHSRKICCLMIRTMDGPDEASGPIRKHVPDTHDCVRVTAPSQVQQTQIRLQFGKQADSNP